MPYKKLHNVQCVKLDLKKISLKHLKHKDNETLSYLFTKRLFNGPNYFYLSTALACCQSLINIYLQPHTDSLIYKMNEQLLRTN